MKAVAPLQRQIPKPAASAGKTTQNPLQLKAEGKVIPVQTKQNPLQFVGESAVPANNNPLQPKKENKTGLPDNLKAGVEVLSGYSMDDVNVHYNSGKPSQLQAYAYTQGTDIHIAPGQEKHLPHEAWHVVQQKQGRVKATIQMKGGIAVNDNEDLEKEATDLGSQALKIEPADLETSYINDQHTSSVASNVVQRAITIGMNPLPRTVHTPANIVDFLKKNGLYDAFVMLNDVRETIYHFGNDQHLINYLKLMTNQPVSENVAKPILSNVSAQQLDQGHKFAADARFASLYQPGASQISENAPGAHKIPNAMLPPSGQGHQWGQTPSPTTGQEYVLYQHQFQHSSNTVPLTFGDPNAPSMVMNQGGLNLGMHIQPTNDSDYLNVITRSDTNYAGLPSDTGRVRGHPFELLQNQISTDDEDMDFDQDRRTYTDESDSTKTNGGISGWRYNEIEKKATASGMPFTQVNNNPVIGAMGIARPDTINFRIQQAPNVYKDLRMDNTATTDYRNTNSVRPQGMGKQAYQTEMGYQEALLHPYQEPSVRKPGEDFTDANRHSYPGYMSPPPTPFLSEDTLAEVEETMILSGYPQVGSKVKMPGGTTGIVTKVIDRDSNRVKSRCLVKSIPATQWPSTFGS